MSLENCFKRTSKLRARNHLRRALVGAAIVPMLAALAPRAATAATKYWDINGATAGAGGATPTGTWDTATANWSTDSAGAIAATTWAANDAAVFSAGTNATGSFNITITGTQTASAMTIEEGTVNIIAGAAALGGNSITVNSGATLSIDTITRVTQTAGGLLILDGGTFRSTLNTSGNSYWTSTGAGIQATAAGGTLSSSAAGGAGIAQIYTGNLLGPGTFTKTGVSEFRFQGANTANSTFSKLIVNQGLFRIGNATGSAETGFGLAPAALTTDAITLDGGQIGLSVSLTLNANRGITIGAAGGTFNGGGGGTMTIPGPISGSGLMTISGGGGVTLQNAGNTTSFTGAVAVTAGTLTLSQSLNATNLSGTGGTVSVSSGRTFTVGSDNTSTTYGGQISGAGAITKIGTGTLTNQTSDWANTGATNINGGVLKLGTSAAGLSSGSAITIAAAGTWDMSTFNDTVGTLAGAGSIVNGGNLSIAGTGSTNFSGGMTLSGTFTKNATSTGTSTLSGSNSMNKMQINAGIATITGSNTIGAGGLAIAGAGTLAASSGRVNFNNNNAAGSTDVFVTGPGAEISCTAVGITTGNTIHLDSAAAGLTDNNQVQIQTTSGNSWEITGKITGVGALIRDNDGAGTITLSGPNDFSGGVFITNRTLVLGSKDALGTGTFTIGDPSTAPASTISVSAKTALTGASAAANPITVNQNFTIGGANDIELSGNVALGTVGHTITVTNTNNSLLSGSISATDASAGITKDGGGLLVLSGATANTYTGPTVVNAGRLTLAKTGGATAVVGAITVGDNTGSDFLSLGGSNQIYDGAPITLNGGTLEAADNSDSVGMLTLSNNSAIDMGAGSSSIFTFADSSAMTWNAAATLSIMNWSGSPTGNGTEQLKFDSTNTALTAPQLAQLFFVNPAGFDPGTYPATFSNDNPGEVIPLVPEPGCLTLLAGAASALLLRRRRTVA